MVANASQNSIWGEDIFILSLQEILGAETFRKIMKQCSGEANQAESGLVQPVARTMSEIYGLSGARGLMVCSGRTAFKYLLRQEDKTLGFTTPQFRLLPTRTKLKRGLQQIAAWMQNLSGESIEIKNEEKQWLFEVSGSNAMNPTKRSGNDCDFTAGLLQEFLAWAGGGKFYRVKEQTCRSTGAACCSFAIDKFPLE